MGQQGPLIEKWRTEGEDLLYRLKGSDHFAIPLLSRPPCGIHLTLLPDLIFTLVCIMQNSGIGTGHKHMRFDLVWFCSNTVPSTAGHERMQQLHVI